MAVSRSVVRTVRSTAPLVVAVAVLLAGTGALAQQEWNPFKERDERTARTRRPAEPLPQALPSMGPGSSAEERPAPFTYGAPYGSGGGGSRGPQAGNSTVERVELAPLEPAPQPGQPQANPDSAPQSTSPDRAPTGGPNSRANRAAANSLPPDLWRGVDMAKLETLITPLEVPPRSPALHALWTQLFTSDAVPPTGGPNGKGNNHYLALQLEALYRSGLITEMGRRLAANTAAATDPLLIAFKVRHDLSTGNVEGACSGTKALAGLRSALPKLLVGEVHLLSGYCAAAAGNLAAAGLAATLAREEEIEATLALDILDALGAGTKGPQANLKLPKRLLVLEYRLLALLGPVNARVVLPIAEPALLFALSQTEADAALALAGAEAAAGINAIAPSALAEIYARVTVPSDAANDPAFQRALLFKAMIAEAVPQRRLQLMRQVLDSGRKLGLSLRLAQAMAPWLPDINALMNLERAGTLGPLAGTAAEIALAGGDYERARQFSALDGAKHWRALIEIADPRPSAPADDALAGIEDVARRGRFPADGLHRLATVLDALDVNIPIPLWEAASRTPQPNTGHLPATGVLPQLAEAAKARQIGHTTLLVLSTIGPGGPDAAHLIALGDSIRALRRAGLDGDARALAVEALLGSWPRS